MEGGTGSGMYVVVLELEVMSMVKHDGIKSIHYI